MMSPNDVMLRLALLAHFHEKKPKVIHKAVTKLMRKVPPDRQVGLALLVQHRDPAKVIWVSLHYYGDQPNGW